MILFRSGASKGCLGEIRCAEAPWEEAETSARHCHATAVLVPKLGHCSPDATAEGAWIQLAVIYPVKQHFGGRQGETLGLMC